MKKSPSNICKPPALTVSQGEKVKWCLTGFTTSPTVIVNAIRKLTPSQAAARPSRGPQSPPCSPPSSPDSVSSPWLGPIAPEPLDIGRLQDLVEPLKGMYEAEGSTVSCSGGAMDHSLSQLYHSPFSSGAHHNLNANAGRSSKLIKTEWRGLFLCSNEL